MKPVRMSTMTMTAAVVGMTTAALEHSQLHCYRLAVHSQLVVSTESVTAYAVEATTVVVLVEVEDKVLLLQDISTSPPERHNHSASESLD